MAKMHTHTLRKILGAHALLAVFLATLFISIFGSILTTEPAAALDSLSGHVSWLAPNVIQYTDAKGHQVNFYEQGKDAQGGDNTDFRSETIAHYLSHNKDGDICDMGDNPESQDPYTYEIDPGDPKLKSDTNPAAMAYVSGITTQSPTFHIDHTAGYARFGGCGADSGGDESFNNKRPDGVWPQTTIGSVKWTSRYTLQVDGAITPPKNPQGQNWDLGKAPDGATIDTWLDSPIPVGREFDQSSNESGGSMSFTSVPPIPASTPPNECDSFTTHITIPYMDYLSNYAYAQIYIPHLHDYNGASCTDAPLAGWVKVSNSRPTLPPTDDSVSAAWADTDKLQISGTLTTGTGVDQSTAIADGTVFKQSSLTGNDMVLSSAAVCGSTPNTLDVNPYTLAPYASLEVYGYGQNNHCGHIETINIKITTAYPNSPVDNTNGDGNSSGNGSTGTPSIQCPVNDPILGWVLCPIFSLASGAVQKLNTLIQSVLFIDTTQIFGPNSGFQTSYNTLRNVGLSLLVLAGLVMVLSQAAGLDIFSAYTIRKALPRIVLAAIGMALAWPILQFAITFFNDLGAWVTDIILLAAPQQSGGGNMGNIGGVMVDLLAGAGVIIFADLTAMALLSLVVTVALGLLLGYAVLVIRQLIVILCIILAPLAIASSVLPGTERLWKFWRESLVGALLMFPIIMGFLAAGAALASVADTTAKHSTGGAVVAFELIAVVAYFAPYFMIPMAFRMASGLMGNIFGMVNDRGKGLFDRLHKFRQSEQEYTRQQRMAGRSRLDRIGNGGLGRFYRRAHTRDGLTFTRRANARMRRLDQALMTANAEKAMKEAGSILGDDDALYLASRDNMTAGRFVKDYTARTGRSARAAREALGSIETAFGSIGSAGSMVSTWKALEASNTGYRSGEAGVVDLANDARRMMRHGYVSRGDAMQIAKTTNPTRTDHNAISWSEWGGALDAKDDLRVGDGRADKMLDSAVNGQPVGRLLGAGHKNAVESLTPAILRRVEKAGIQLKNAIDTRSPDRDKFERAYYQAVADGLGALDVASQLSPENSNELANTVMNNNVYVPKTTMVGPRGTPITFGGGAMIASEAFELLRTNPVVDQKRREFNSQAAYASATAAAAATATGAAGGAGGAGAAGGGAGTGTP